jgi:RimJ/RimL family protein N-acetyltransferase
MSTVKLRPIDDKLLPRLLDVAVAGAAPDEVMPTAPGSSGWTPEHRTAFGDYYGSGPAYAILADDELLGATRLTPAQAPGAAKAGIWLARSARGKGHGTEALHLLVEEARSQGVTALIVETTTSNPAAMGALRALGAKLWEDTESGAVHATLRVGDWIEDGIGR